MANNIASVQDMERALSLAEPRGPSGLPDPDPGAALALACHCVMVDNGFLLMRPSGDDPSNKWAPPPRWAKELKDEWVFRYTLAGKRNPLVLHCSLQRVSGRMLVHTIEVNNERNSNLLGLLLEKYVPDNTLLRNKGWEGVMQSTDALAFMMQQHVLTPLLEAAEDVPETAMSTGASWSAGNAGASNRSFLYWISHPAEAAGGSGGSSYVVPAVIVTALAVTAVGVYVARQQRQR